MTITVAQQGISIEEAKTKPRIRVALGILGLFIFNLLFPTAGALAQSPAPQAGISFAAGGKWLLVTNTGAGTLSVIDTARDEVIKTIKVPAAPEGITYWQP